MFKSLGFLSWIRVCCLAVLLLGGCLEKPEAVEESTLQRDELLGGLENRLGKGKTDFLRQFSESEIPWQIWEPEVLEKARLAEVPIFVVVGSSSETTSHEVVQSLSQSKRIREELSENFLCSVVDVERSPEMKLLSLFLAVEIRQEPGLPLLMWISPEGYPMAWTTVTAGSVSSLDTLALNSIMMVRDTWEESRDYAKENSLGNQEQRLKRLNYLWGREAEEVTRGEVYKEMSREFLALYDPIESDFDGSSFVLPSAQIDLLSLVAMDPRLSEEVRGSAKRALRGLLDRVVRGSLHDPVDGGYFMASRSRGRSFPVFAKTLSSQAKLAGSFFRVGAVLDSGRDLEAGMELLKSLEKTMLGEVPVSVMAPPSDWSRDGLFLWSTEELGEILTPEELTFAKELYGLKDRGNTALELELDEGFFRLNSLNGGRRVSEVASDLVLELEVARQVHEALLGKLRLARREFEDEFFLETRVPADVWASVVQMYVAAAGEASGAREKALKYGRSLKSQYVDSRGQFLRFPDAGEMARGQDYGQTILAALSLYRLTLDTEWLTWATNLSDEALKVLQTPEGGFREVPEAVETIPGAFADYGFGAADSSLAMLECGLGQLAAITGKEEYSAAREKIWLAMYPSRAENFTGKVDLLEGIALGDEPLVCAMSVEPESEKGKAFLGMLNDSYYSRVVVTARSSDVSSQVEGTAAVTLFKAGEVVGEAETVEELASLIEQNFVAQ